MAEEILQRRDDRVLVRAGDVVRHLQHPWSEATRMLLDFEYARPGDPLDDVAFALEYVVPFRDDATCLRWHRFTEPPDRRRRLKLFAEAYGLVSADGLVHWVIMSQRRQVEIVRRLAERGDRRQVDLVASGYLLELQDRIQWSVRTAT
jgi:aminoglycoside phosphotransferase (APT) family kinase protein